MCGADAHNLLAHAAVACDLLALRAAEFVGDAFEGLVDVVFLAGVVVGVVHDGGLGRFVWAGCQGRSGEDVAKVAGRSWVMWRLCTSLYDSGVREKSAGVDRTDGSRLGHVGVCGADLFAQIVVSLGFRALVDSAVGMDRAVILVHQVSIRDSRASSVNS
jgi:hypothetical protein